MNYKSYFINFKLVKTRRKYILPCVKFKYNKVSLVGDSRSKCNSILMRELSATGIY